MSKVIKLSIILVLAVMAAILAAGCAGVDVKNMAAEDVRQILADSVEATTAADSFTFTMDAAVSANMTGEAGGTMSAEMTGSGAADLENKTMKFSMDASAAVNMGFFNMSFEDIGVEMYKVGEWVYQRMTLAGEDTGWTKSPALHEGADGFERENMREQLAFVEFPAEVELLREEKLNGEDCYVIRIVPDARKLSDAVSSLPEASGPMTNAELQELEDVLDEMDFTVWIAKDSKLLLKFVLDATIDTSEFETTAAMPSPTDSLPITMDGDAIMNIDVTVVMSEYNEDVDITLPPDAANAVEGDPGSLFEDEFSGMFGGDPLDDPEAFNEFFKDTDFGELFKDGQPDMDKLSDIFGDELPDFEELSKQLEDLGVINKDK